MTDISRRNLVLSVTATVSALAFSRASAAGVPGGLRILDPDAIENPDSVRLASWSATLRREGLSQRKTPIGQQAARVGELAAGSPYEPFMLEAYIKAGGSPIEREPVALSLTRFDCVTLVESCLAVARASARSRRPAWKQFAAEVERMRYRDGIRRGYASRLHYFSEWISDGERRGLTRDLARDLGGARDRRPLRFMTEHRDSYPALANETVFREIGAIEKRLDGRDRWMIPTDRIPAAVDRIQTGDVLAFATSIAGLDVSHAAFAWRDDSNVLRVLHAPLSGGVVEVTTATLPEYVARIRRATGLLVARPLRG